MANLYINLKMKRIFLLICSVIILISCGNVEELITNFEQSTVTDCDGNEYPTVKIGDQWWMAENLKCTKYDTESAQAGKTIIQPTGSVFDVSIPYHVRILATTNSIISGTGVNHSVNLTADHRAKIGYLYNWPAALGLENGLVDTVFVEKQQGICPNGWHIPTDEEWTILTDYISKKCDGKYKTATGWFDNNKPTENDPAFAVLPAGYAYGRTMRDVGFSANFLSSTSSDTRGSFCRSLSYMADVVEKHIEMKGYATSVRCVKDH